MLLTPEATIVTVGRVPGPALPASAAASARAVSMAGSSARTAQNVCQAVGRAQRSKVEAASNKTFRSPSNGPGPMA